MGKRSAEEEERRRRHCYNDDGTPKDLQGAADNSPWWTWTPRMKGLPEDDPYAMENTPDE